MIGDVGRTENLVDVCRDADALVIEATYMEEEAQMARDFAHLTARQAARLAQEAGVGHLILTHISRRYRERDVLGEARAVFAELASWRAISMLSRCGAGSWWRYTGGDEGQTFMVDRALFFPDVGFVVVAGLFPEAQPVAAHELQAAQPLGAFPEIGRLQVVTPGQVADHAAQRVAVVGRRSARRRNASPAGSCPPAPPPAAG